MLHLQDAVSKYGGLFMKYPIVILLISSCYACTSYPVKDNNNETLVSATQCLGNTEPPEQLADKFKAIEDEALLQQALGEPEKGKLCQGQVYKTEQNSEITIYRAWNSTNPNSKLGNWWAFHIPQGKVAQYRSDYEICYQWSPLDKLIQCKLAGGAKVVIGNGQSAECSPYLTYPASAEKQIYIEDAAALVSDCTLYDGEFRWQVVQNIAVVRKL